MVYPIYLVQSTHLIIKMCYCWAWNVALHLKSLDNSDTSYY